MHISGDAVACVIVYWRMMMMMMMMMIMMMVMMMMSIIMCAGVAKNLSRLQITLLLTKVVDD